MIERQKTRHICKCGQEAVARKKSTGEWLCMVCVAKDMCNGKGIKSVYMARADDDTLDFLVPLADLLPIRFCRN